MFNISKDQTIALTGLYQSLALVQNIAWEGNTDHSCMVPTIESIFEFIKILNVFKNKISFMFFMKIVTFSMSSCFTFLKCPRVDMNMHII